MKDNFFYKLILPNLSVKILSVIGAVFFWLLITNIADPVKTKVFEIPVTVTNEDSITTAGKVYEIVSGKTASVRVTAKRSIVDNLENTDIRAEADMSNLSTVNAVSIEPVLLKKVKSEVNLECKNVLKIKLDELLTKQLKVTVVTEGTPADGYSVGDAVAKPNMITVSGSKSVVDSISVIKVVVNVDAVTSDFVTKVTPKAYDSSENEITSPTLSFSDNKIRIKTRVVENKTVPVSVSITGTPASGYEYVNTECVPKEIEVSGSGKKYSELDKIIIPIDISGLKDDSDKLEQTINVYDYIDASLKVAEEYETISIKVNIEKVITKMISVKKDSIIFKNLSKNHLASIDDGNEEFSFVLSGRDSIINAIPQSALVPYIDCTGMKVGENQGKIVIDEGSGYKIVSHPTVTVKITKSKKSESTKTTAPDIEKNADVTEQTQTPAVSETPVASETPATDNDD